MHDGDTKILVSKDSENRISDLNKHFFNSMTMRLLVLIALLLLSLIPTKMLENLVESKINGDRHTVAELSSQWGNEQTIIGPILSIPYVERISRIESQTDNKGVKSSVSRDIFNNKVLRFLPENLSINANLKDKVLKRDKVHANVYQAEVELSGNFNLDTLPEASGYNSIEWDNAFIAVGLIDNISAEASMPLRWEGSSSVFKPGTQLIEYMPKGIHAKLEEVANESTSPKFKLQLSLKGDKNLRFAPLGELTSINLTTDSANARVSGKLSPSSKIRSTEGMEATWRISNLSRNYPQQWLIGDGNKDSIAYDFNEVLTGVEFSASDNGLNKIKKSIPYLSIIVAIVFLSLFILEYRRNSLSKPNLSHYLVVSLPIFLVPILLLTYYQSFPFIQAFSLAAGVSVALITIYFTTTLKSFSLGLYILLILASLYGALFFILEMPAYALLATSTAGLFITTILMLTSWNTEE